MKLTAVEYKEFFSGYHIFDCAVRSKTVFSFLLIEEREDNGPTEKVIINYFPMKPEGHRIGWAKYEGFGGPKIAVSLKPKEQAIMVARDCTIAVLGAGDAGMEDPIPKGGPEQPLYTSAHGLATINGIVYAAGGWRGVCRRISPNHWEQVGDRNTLPIPKRNSYGSNDEGFTAIDGFNEHDIYCAGGRGDVWRFDGIRWQQCAIPSNFLLENVCCAGDGYVYLGMQSGTIMRGRENTWEMIYRGHFTLPFKDIVWFQDRVWCTSDYGIWCVVDGQFIEPDLPASARACSGNLAVGDGVMLLAGRFGATVYDGQQWTPLISA